jgi:two-component system, NarL family, sensor kinase
MRSGVARKQAVLNAGPAIPLPLVQHPNRSRAASPEPRAESAESSSAETPGALLQASFDTLPALVVILDAHGTVVASNLAWERFVEANALEATGSKPAQNLLSLYRTLSHCCPQARAIAQRLGSVLAGRSQAVRQSYCWQTAAGLRWFDLRASRLDVGGGRYVIVVNDDVSAAKMAEQALSQAAEHLLTLQDEERRRIAGELHDSTAQHLAAAGLNLAGLRAKLGEQAAQACDLLNRIESSIDDATRELRSLTYLLHPPSLAADGLEATLRRYIDGFERRTGLRTALRFGRRVNRLPLEVQHCVLRIVQEALANVHRHAGASGAWVDLKWVLGRLHLVVRDNGRGMAGAHAASRRLPEPPRSGVGIPGIRSRLRRFGGKLVIRSGRNGTALHAIVPLALRAVRSAPHEQPGQG